MPGAMSQPLPPVAPVVEIERRLHWRALALGGFLVLMAGLAAVAAISLLAPPRIATGLPDDPEVAAARAAVHGRLPMRTGALRFRSSLTGEPPRGGVFGPDEAALAERAGTLLERARVRRPGDLRLEVALAHLDLALQRYERAERRYRTAAGRGADVPEARLGLGVALALRASEESDRGRARGLRLEAIAQLTAVNAGTECYAPALYDRALLLAEVGRGEEAAGVAREYLELDPESPWAPALRRAVGITGP
jgi:tetratricopeptide (TPR) repeat protein